MWNPVERCTLKGNGGGRVLVWTNMSIVPDDPGPPKTVVVQRHRSPRHISLESEGGCDCTVCLQVRFSRDTIKSDLEHYRAPR